MSTEVIAFGLLHVPTFENKNLIIPEQTGAQGHSRWPGGYFPLAEQSLAYLTARKAALPPTNSEHSPIKPTWKLTRFGLVLLMFK